MQSTQNNNSHPISNGVDNVKKFARYLGVSCGTFIKDFAIPVTGTIATIIVAGVGYIATIEAANIQAKATKDAANVDKPAAETLSSSSLLAKKLIDSKEENINDIQGKLIKADLFTTLRNLDGKGKGHLIRFLHEGGFIKVKKQEVSDKQEISLSGANLIKIDLENAWLPDINLKGAYISAGNLSQTSLKRANLIEAKLNGADLTGADLTDADLTNADLTDAKYNDSTTFPNGFKPDEEGMKYMKYCTNPIQCNS